MWGAGVSLGVYTRVAVFKDWPAEQMSGEHLSPDPLPRVPHKCPGEARFHPTGPQAPAWGKLIFLPGGIWGART